jgi:hypothetical protein
MPEALVYRLHRNILLINLVPLILSAVLLGRLLTDIIFGLYSLVSLALFVLDFLGEEKVYTFSALFGGLQASSAFAFSLVDPPLLRSIAAVVFGVMLVILALASRSRFLKAREKKHLSDFVPPAFG